MEIEVQIIQAIAEHLGLSSEDLESGALLREDLGLGPIELNDLISNLSQKFNVSFESDEIKNLKKLSDLIVLVEDNLID